MARLSLRRKTPVSTKDRAIRASKTRVRNGKFIDPFFQVHGTLPEKMVYAELSRRGIPFLFLNDIQFNFPEIDFSKEYQADFVIDSLKIIIEVNGSYWHSMAKTIEEDAFKYAVYEMKGYKVLAWWDYDIYDRLQWLFAMEPALVAASTFPASHNSSELAVVSRKKQDTSGGIRTLNYKRAQRGLYKKAAIRQKMRRRG